jgi:hypothetical protein
VSGFISDCLGEMRAYIPASIFKLTLTSLAEESGYSQMLAKRLVTKKCLWLIRMDKEDIAKVHASDLVGKFNPMAQGLDIIEIGALLGALPEKFNNDPDGRKQKLRTALEQAFKSMWTQQQKNLPEQSGQGHTRLHEKIIKVRHAAYKCQSPAYFGRGTLHRLDAVSPSASQSALSITDEIAHIRSNSTSLSSGSWLARGRSFEEDDGTPIFSTTNPMITRSNNISMGCDAEAPPNVASIAKKLSAMFNPAAVRPVSAKYPTIVEQL